MGGKVIGLHTSVSYHKSSAPVRNLPSRDSRRGELPSASAGGYSLTAVAALLGVCLFLFFQAVPLHAQERKNKVPIVGKLATSNRPAAYSGKIESLDVKHGIMNVNPIEGRNSEIFPFKKNVRIENLNGGRMELNALTPGTAVLIYFDQKSGERNIKNIVVLGSGKEKEQAGDKPTPAS